MTRLQFPMPAMDHHIERLGMTHHPFPAVPDGNHYYMHDTLQALLHEVLFTLNQRRGFVVITGEVGLGKSTFSRVLLQELATLQAATALVLNSVVQETALLEQIIVDFGLTPCSKEMPELLHQLNHFLLSNKKNAVTSVVVIDDAQNLSAASLELIRLLTSFETSSEKLLQIVLLGQPELQDTLNTKSMRQLKSRIALSRQFLPLSKAQMAQYIKYKTQASGYDALQVSRLALTLIYRATRGVPRLVNLLMDRVLIVLAAKQTSVVSRDIIRLAIVDVGEAFFYYRSSQKKIIFGCIYITMMVSAAFLASKFAVVDKVKGHYDDWLQSSAEQPITSRETQSEAPSDSTNTTVSELEPVSLSINKPEVKPAPQVSMVTDAAPAVIDITPTTAGNGTTTTSKNERAERALQELTQRLLPEQEASSLWQFYAKEDVLAALAAQNSTIIINWLQRSGNLQVVSFPLHAVSEQGQAVCFAVKHECIFTWSGLSSLQGELSNMQMALANAGLYGGDIDGMLGVQTLGAIKKLQFVLGLPATASLDQATLFALYHIQFFRI
ncbi:AAA family ATPase [Pseudoalteromonas sp. SCSIO 43201]|uniref:ExeA family protein n=1 Tax=Pseudoalteromonas sp. SCSIO 43201 TaxID=2822842 RepID=UPI0020757A6A|nr:ExeA family protein [Pseudoalteromonas sp. SCSIO 43201]USD29246.1 AAA family ATPase [Pseudoalteromonas sp. SCSIO 43201]